MHSDQNAAYVLHIIMRDSGPKKDKSVYLVTESPPSDTISVTSPDGEKLDVSADVVAASKPPKPPLPFLPVHHLRESNRRVCEMHRDVKALLPRLWMSLWASHGMNPHD